jgi:hypothetical protein
MLTRRFYLLGCIASCLGLASDLLWAQANTVAKTSEVNAQRFPDVLSMKVKAARADVFDFDVTISSTYDTPERYADGFRVTTLAGQVLGERTLWHDHQDEQPFTRDLYGVKIPAGISKVLVQGRDKKFGYGGKTVSIILPGR